MPHVGILALDRGVSLVRRRVPLLRRYYLLGKMVTGLCDAIMTLRF
ncbi:hypothetical protein RCH09_002667 [Actimicrobium sp. GrIS 1.19]|nr:hypothetical protein [Actimicrobium sp. GrIS 1.19]